MTRTRAWTGGVAVGCLLFVVAAWFLAIAPQRAEAADLRQRAVAQQATNDLTRLRTQQLKAQYAELPARQADLRVIARQMPATPQLAVIVRTVTSMAVATGVSLRSITPTAPTAGAASATAAGGSAVTTMPTTLVVAGDYAAVTLFLQKLQAAKPSPRHTTMERAYLVQSVSLAPDSTTPDGGAVVRGRVQLTVTGQFFVMAAPTVPTLTIAPAR